MSYESPHRHFHFTLGPVQGFVAQARRTRDFWVGSFLISYLAGVAMKEVIAQEGTICFPEPDEHFLGWLDGSVRNDGEEPQQGAIPNCFRASVPNGFKPSRVKKAVKTAWRELVERVWESDLKGYAGEESRKIWEEQVNGFWEISWVLTEDEKASDLLDRRKNWRTHFPRPQAGVKCMMMAGWQELSGAARPGEEKLQTFWRELRKHIRDGETDLRENEHLCAIAFVK